MYKDVYTHILQTYGHNPGQWFGFFTEVTRTLLLRVGIPLVMADITVAIAMMNQANALQQIFLLLALQIAGAVIGVIGDLVATRSENNQYGRLLQAYHRKLTGKDMSFYRDHQTGYLTSLFRQYLDGVLQLVRFLRNEGVRTVISLSVPALILLYGDWRVGLSAIAIVVIQVVYVLWSSKKATIYRLRSHEIYRQITGEVSDEITNIVAFKAGGVDQEARQKIAQLAKEETKTFWLRRKTANLLDLPRNILNAIGITIALYFAATTTATDASSVGFIVLTLTYMFQIMRNAAELPNVILQHDDYINKIHPTLKYLENTHESIKDPVKPQPLQITEARIDIEHVGFSYPDHTNPEHRISVFADLTIHIRGGEQVGIVGLSGAGKSTLASLLMRFDDVETGAIKIDDIDIRNVRQNELRQKVAYVPQEPLLFHRTIRENIAYFNNEASDNDIIRAAKAAHAHEFITKLPRGYDTLVGERGVKLSGGQKQRVAIARAILKNAPIVLFDEATSALDSESEQIIQQAMPEIIGKHTALVIAHRLSTVAGLDRIIVMHEGRIAEEGRHEELLQLQGHYYRLWQKQTKAKTI